MNTPIINVKKTGENIKYLRKKMNLSVSMLAEKMGNISFQTVYKWQQGVMLPTVDNLVILSAIFDVSIEEILVIMET